jgi:hypothetical protein
MRAVSLLLVLSSAQTARAGLLTQPVHPHSAQHVLCSLFQKRHEPTHCQPILPSHAVVHQCICSTTLYSLHCHIAHRGAKTKHSTTKTGAHAEATESQTQCRSIWRTRGRFSKSLSAVTLRQHAPALGGLGAEQAEVVFQVARHLHLPAHQPCVSADKTPGAAPLECPLLSKHVHNTVVPKSWPPTPCRASARKSNADRAGQPV